jgi:hypothetical protein
VTAEPLAVPEGIAALGPDVPARVQSLVRDAEARQERELAEALDTSLRIVPRPLRGLVRKVLLG